MAVRALVEPVARRLAGPVMHRLARVAGGPPPYLRRGTGHALADVPVVLVVVAGADEASVADVLGSVSAAQWATDAFTPVFVLDAPVLAPVRRAGYVVELAGPGGLGEAVAEARLTYAADLVVVVGPGGQGALISVLVSWRPGAAGPLARARRRLRSLEARLGRLR